jgi:hypothetical protein
MAAPAPKKPEKNETSVEVPEPAPKPVEVTQPPELDPDDEDDEEDDDAEVLNRTIRQAVKREVRRQKHPDVDWLERKKASRAKSDEADWTFWAAVAGIGAVLLLSVFDLVQKRGASHG